MSKTSSSLYLLLITFLFSCGHEENKGGDKVIYDNSPQKETDSGYFNLNDFQSLVENYEDPERSDWQNPDLVIEKMGNINNKIVADIGAGTGYFTFRLAAKGSKVIAIDIDKRFIEYIEERTEEMSSTLDQRISTRISKEDDPLLEPKEVDMALLVNTYHFITDRVDYLQKIGYGLKENGMLVIVDYKNGEMPVGPPLEFRVSESKVKEELKKAGFEVSEIDLNSLDYQYIITAQKK